MLKFLIALLSMLPLPVARGLGQLCGIILWKSQTRMARITLQNLELCMPELSVSERRQLACRSLQETSKLALEVAKVWQKNPDWTVRQVIAEEGKPLLDSALASGRPVILLAPHLGNWEALGPYLARQKPITILYLPPSNPKHDRFIIESREKAGIQLAPANRKGVMSLLKTAKAGGFIGILPDQEPERDGGEFAPFFNQPALTMTLVHKLIQKEHCLVVMGYAERVKGGFKAVFSEPHQDIYSHDTTASLAALNKSIENCIMHIPEQYQWEYKRFKEHPSGNKKVNYRKHKITPSGLQPPRQKRH